MIKRSYKPSTFILLILLTQTACGTTEGDSDASGTPDGQCNNTATTACDPNDLTKVFTIDACGMITGVRDECSEGRLCNQSSPTALATCKIAPVCSGALTDATGCAGNDPSAIYSIDDCGDLVDVIAQTCDPGMVCQTINATTAQCACDVSSDRVCNPDDPSAVYFLDTCGEIHSIQRSCPPSFVCGGDDPLAAECVAEVETCSPTLNKACVEDDLSAVFYINTCGEPEGIFEQCGEGEACKLTPGNSTPHCYSTDQCVTTLEKICLESDLSAVFYVDSCGEIEGTFETCGPDEACKLTPGNSTPHCYSTDQCVTTLEKVCLASDLSAVFYVDSCGEIEGTFETCGPDEACKLRAGSSVPHCYSTNECVNTLDKICDNSDLSSIFYLNSCGEISGIFEACGAGESCTIEPGNANPQCRVPCWPTHTTIACSQDLRSTEWVNACGDLTGEIVTACAADEECDNNQCKSIPDPCDPPRASTTCDPSDVSAAWWVNGCGEMTGEVAADCAVQGLTCQNGQCVANCDQPLGAACRNEAPWFLTGESTIRETDTCGRITDTIIETCAAGEFCTTRSGVPTCMNSMTDTASPYYLKACSFGMYVDAQTDLYMDCRCRKDQASDPTSLNGSILNCWTVESAWGPGNLRQAAGPHLYPIEPLVLGGLISEVHGEVFSAMQYTDPSYTGGGLVVAYNYETGDRRIVSGIYANPAGGYVEYGSGYKSLRMVGGVPREETAHNYISDLEMGSDGMLYAYGNGTLENIEIVRVNPTSGARTLVWRVEQKDGSVSPFGQCYGSRTIDTTASGQIPLQYEQRAFAMDPATGKFYLGFRNPSDGVGVVEIAADGSTCRIVSRTWAADLPDIGSGFSPQYTSLSGMHVRDGKVYVVHILQEALVAYDIATGNRTAVSVPGSIGEGDHAMGQNNIFWDASRDLMWVMGSPAPFIGFAVDLASGDRDSVYRISPGGLLPGEYPVEQGHAGALRSGNYIGYGTVVLHPTNNDIVYMIGRKGEMYEYEISTGNSWIKSL
jgi:hypothetical protein